jgi:hypothetical protein
MGLDYDLARALALSKTSKEFLLLELARISSPWRLIDEINQSQNASEHQSTPPMRRPDPGKKMPSE